MKAIILFGAPGSGKGTVAERIKAVTGYIHISTGDMLRAAVKNGTAVGREAEAYMKRGELVPDEVIIKLVEERLDKGGPEDLYMFDGFPRTVPQSELLEKSLGRRGGKVTHVLFLDTPRDVLLQRLTGRRTCRKCGWNCHIVNLPPKKSGICNLCGGELYQRPDDQEATIVNRLEVYNKQTESLIARYDRQKVLVKVNSNQKVDKLVEDIRQILK
ncbi:MAG: adenylate kinase [Kiritimatiellae bacterium]|nr:adenylate kinase [Kiritimatiellia bacterium]MDD5522248.1 adenylate kinase [Kiritimatiellia bacterium]